MSGSRQRSAPHPGRRLRLSVEKTRRLLDPLARTCAPEYLDTDPLGLVREWDAPPDREIVAPLAAGLAGGKVASIRRSVRAALGAIGESPSGFVDRLDPARAVERLEGFAHRFTTATAFVDLLWRVRMAREAAARWLLPAPSRRSACKRHRLFRRWMVRPDGGVDLGLWRDVSPSRLPLPLDVHLERVVVALGWTRRRGAGWPMILEATACLRRIDPIDPVRYDFALSRLGIVGLLPDGAAVLRRCRRAAALGG